MSARSDAFSAAWRAPSRRCHPPTSQAQIINRYPRLAIVSEDDDRGAAPGVAAALERGWGEVLSARGARSILNRAGALVDDATMQVQAGSRAGGACPDHRATGHRACSRNPQNQQHRRRQCRLRHRARPAKLLRHRARPSFRHPRRSRRFPTPCPILQHHPADRRLDPDCSAILKARLISKPPARC